MEGIENASIMLWVCWQYDRQEQAADSAVD